jgi:hypothetical protein
MVAPSRLHNKDTHGVELWHKSDGGRAYRRSLHTSILFATVNDGIFIERIELQAAAILFFKVVIC